MTPAGCPQAGGVGQAEVLSFQGRRDGDHHMHKRQLNLQRWGLCEWHCGRGDLLSAWDGDDGGSGYMELLPLFLIWL